MRLKEICKFFILYADTFLFVNSTVKSFTDIPFLTVFGDDKQGISSVFGRSNGIHACTYCFERQYTVKQD